MNSDRRDDEGWQEEKTVSIFGEKTVAERETTTVKEPENTESAQDDKKDTSGRWLTVIVAAAVVIVGIAGIGIWQSKAGEGNAPTAEETAQQEEAAAAKEENMADAAEGTAEADDAGEAMAEPVVDEVEEKDTDDDADGIAEIVTGETEEGIAQDLYNLFSNYNEIKEEDGLAAISDIPAGPVEEIYRLIRSYHAGDDVAEVSLAWERYGQAPIYYMGQLQREEPVECTCYAGDTEDGESIVVYINTARSIYYVGETPLESSGMYNGTVYYDVTVDETTGMVDFYVYKGLWYEGEPGDVGDMIHVVDEISDSNGKLESATNAYCVDQNGNALTFYDIYNNEGGRRVEASNGRYEKDLVPEWEFGELEF